MAMYRRANLATNDQRQLERQQFNNIDDDEREWQNNVEAYWKNCLAEFTEGTVKVLLNSICINQVYVKMKHKDVAELFMPRGAVTGRGRFNLSTETVQTYIACICRYINARRRPPKNRSRPVGASGKTRTKTRSRSPVSGKSRFGYREANPIEPEINEIEDQSCVMMAMKDFDYLMYTDDRRRDAEIARVFRELDVDENNFMNLDYLFIPHFEEGTAHHYLVGIAPKQRFLFVIDSCFRFEHDGEFSTILREFIRFGTKSESISQAWPIYGQWATRSERTTDGSPDVPSQRDQHNCGLFTVTNAFCLAFGYDLLCYSQDDLNDLKRRRMTAELSNGGFGGVRKYHYPVLDLPGNSYTLFDPTLQASNYYKDRGMEPAVPTGESSTVANKRNEINSSAVRPVPAPFTIHSTPSVVDPMDIVDPREDFPEQRGFEPGSHITKRDRIRFPGVRKLRVPKQHTPQELDDLLLRIFEYKPCQYAKLSTTPARESDESGDDDASDTYDEDSDAGNDGDDAEAIPTSNQLYVNARKLLDGRDCPQKTSYLKKLTAIDDHPWPPQFSRRIHQKAGLIYPIVSLPPGCGVAAPSTRKDLRDGCRRFPLKAVNDTKTQSRAAARDWAETEMSAFMARALVEVKTKPYPGIGRGYTKHKPNLDTNLATEIV
jgi:hypothetical protein